MTRSVRSLLLFAAPAALVGVVVFLLASGLHTHWDGRLAAVAAAPSGATTRVLIVGDHGVHTVATWPSALVKGRSVPIDPRLYGPTSVPEDAPRTRKAAWQLAFTVENAAGTLISVPTVSVRAASVGMLVFLVLIGVRNMVISGSPMRIDARDTVLPAAQPPAGQVVPPKPARPKKGPPPQRRRGRRR